MSSRSRAGVSVLGFALVLGSSLLGCRQERAAAEIPPPRCETITDVPGEYRCSGDCVVTKTDGQREVLHVAEETDTVLRYPGTSAELYQVNIQSGDFRELEIGPLVGDTLRTATATVSDEQFPVLEDYVFESDAACKARAFAKVVRNPSKAGFKACLIRCQKGE